MVDNRDLAIICITINFIVSIIAVIVAPPQVSTQLISVMRYVWVGLVGGLAGIATNKSGG